MGLLKVWRGLYGEDSPTAYAVRIESSNVVKDDQQCIGFKEVCTGLYCVNGL